MPKIRGAVTDRDRRRFMKDAFDHIQEHFDHALAELARQNPQVEFDLTPHTKLYRDNAPLPHRRSRKEPVAMPMLRRPTPKNRAKTSLMTQ